MKNEIKVLKDGEIQSKIYSIRGYQVMLDSDLAVLYDVKTKNLNLAVKRNIERFPNSFRFQLTEEEYKSLRLQIETSKEKRGGRRYLPFVFTEQGVAMLSAVLRSKTAINMSIQIMQAFVRIKKILSTNAGAFQRLDKVEQKQLEYKIETDTKFDKVFSALESKDTIPKQGIFFDGQIFDAYNFLSNLFKRANESVTIIDNYIDNSVLIHLTEVKKNVKVKILTRSISPKLKQDIKKFENQYFSLTLKIVKNYHDRFIIIDKKEVYHIGASLKDLGKKLFGFSKMDKTALNILSLIEEI
ncbi:MAG: ORF6N domain-containing protein [Candidatus Delongbacteria bacterium]|nr:ORF6N domain-containing protein [Candidatus Delongbacteria bacterium]